MSKTLKNAQPNADTAQIALAFTAAEETSALRSTVAWTVYIVDKVGGWNGTPVKGGRKVAIKAARQTYGYKRNSDGTPMLDASGNRIKRSAIYARLSLVEALIDYTIKHQATWIETIHAAATNPETNPEIKRELIEQLVEEYAATIENLVGDSTNDALKFWLANGEAKKDSKPVAAPKDALAANADKISAKMTSGSKQIFPRFKGQSMRALVNGRTLFAAKSYLFEYKPEATLLQKGTNPEAITITPILASTGEESYHYFCLPNDPDLLRELSEHLDALSYEIEEDTDTLKAEHA